MANDFQGSIAQEHVQFTTEVTVGTSPGANFYKLAVYVNIADAAAIMVDVGDAVEGEALLVQASDYASIVQGTLKKKLDAYFKEQQSYGAYIVFFGTTATLEVCFGLYKSYAYFITIDSDVNAEWTELATLQAANKDLTAPLLMSLESYDETVESSLLKAFVDGAFDAWAFYATDADDSNPALYQLGRSLSYLNASGTPVGNSMDYVSCLNINAADDGENLDSTAKSACEALNISYFNTVGNSTGAVACIGGKSLNSTVMAAQWIVAYCNFVNRIKVAELITRMNTFRNDSTYFKIKQLVVGTVGLFTESSGMGRLTGFILTAPPFNKLPGGGDEIVVPNAWEATYVDNVRSVTVQGNLYINA